MRIDAEVRGQLTRRFEVLLPHLNELQQRLALDAEARLLGHGGIRAVADVAGVSATTVRKGVGELESGGAVAGGASTPGRWGRKRVNEQDPELTAALLRLVEPDERGDPMSPLRWTTKSLRHPGCRVDPTGPSDLCSLPLWAGCCGRPGSACKGRPRRWRVSSIPIGTRSSPTSTSR
jgi:hypothetical protein